MKETEKKKDRELLKPRGSWSQLYTESESEEGTKSLKENQKSACAWIFIGDFINEASFFQPELSL